jgi:hypothetical protein
MRADNLLCLRKRKFNAECIVMRGPIF